MNKHLQEISLSLKDQSATISHGASFPEELVERILVNFSQEGDLIYDPFMGTGTTAVVAKRLGRKWLGSEMSPQYAEFARERIKRTIVGHQEQLF